MSDPGSIGISSEDNDTVCQMKNGWMLCTDDFVGGKMVRDIVYFSPAMVTQEHKIKEGQISVFPDFSFLFFHFFCKCLSQNTTSYIGFNNPPK